MSLIMRFKRGFLEVSYQWNYKQLTQIALHPFWVYIWVSLMTLSCTCMCLKELAVLFYRVCANNTIGALSNRKSSSIMYFSRFFSHTI